MGQLAWSLNLVEIDMFFSYFDKDNSGTVS